MDGNWDASIAGGAGQVYKWLPVIDEDICTGCGLCVEVCGPNCLDIVDEIVMLLSAKTCGSEERCIAACPEDAIHMQWIPMRGIMSIGKWTVIDVHSGRRAME